MARLCFLLISIILFCSWGFKAHKTINELAIYSLQNDEIFAFYKSNHRFIVEHAVDADTRKFTNYNEVPQHFMDVDAYEYQMPLDSINCSYKDAVRIWGRKFMLENGTLPWSIVRHYHWLVGAFEKKDKDKILQLSADIGHYLSDAHVPLHTVSNYNGQKTNQNGIHGLWETQVPELFMDTLLTSVQQQQYITDVSSFVFQTIQESYCWSQDVLHRDKELRNSLKHKSFKNGKYGVRFTSKYCKRYQEALSLKVSDRMRTSAQAIADIWYSAWIEAGQPQLI